MLACWTGTVVGLLEKLADGSLLGFDIHIGSTVLSSTTRLMYLTYVAKIAR